MSHERRSSAQMQRISRHELRGTPRMQTAGRLAMSTYNRVGTLAKRVQQAIDENGPSSGVPIQPLDEEDSLVVALDQAIASAPTPTVVARTRSR